MTRRSGSPKDNHPKTEPRPNALQALLAPLIYYNFTLLLFIMATWAYQTVLSKLGRP
jgi:hypothetical protein